MIRSFSISSRGDEETRLIGKIIGEMAEAGNIIALKGDLGSGKTALVQGLARGLNVPEKIYVTSPSYTLVQEYPGRLPLFHIDLYRLSEMDFEDIGLYDILDTKSAVVAIEWAERLSPDTLFECLTLQLEITGDNTRNIVFTADGDQQAQLLTRIEHRLKENLWH
jgi:tRNA threonylcarbamoyladenosine biosynthesis protein TsaE